ncbi:DUF1365 domain-containing protein [Vibrio panuliri]|uniref:Chromosome partitioning protein ParA n=1 Tax=Vibrio panuliri TaxID=1381081 RepID=A0ABX3FRH0_9VIBR|nr:DUF1365 family protein [Vibrio panuliri]KAB1454754.1 DUF1365 family protein [Vibrio panuliri]OLQ96535.1 chromosome partitioning protein ParA [Vibrio panuliri]
MKSALLVGSVRHRRFTPVKHSLSYPLFMPCLDLDELDLVFSHVWGLGDKWWHWARFRREDYLGKGDLKRAVLDKVCELTGDNIADGRVEAVIHLRYLGLYFSPVNFYYIYDCDNQWRYLLAEVSNTPWNERHYYVVPATGNGRYEHDKAFHVSPFNPVEQKYHWMVKPLSSRLHVHLECHREDKEFDATLSMRKQPLSEFALAKKLIVTPVMAVKVTIGIYWHALKLWWKGAPFYSHPKYRQDSDHQEKSNKGA